jgi:hypothetical protein
VNSSSVRGDEPSDFTRSVRPVPLSEHMFSNIVSAAEHSVRECSQLLAEQREALASLCLEVGSRQREIDRLERRRDVRRAHVRDLGAAWRIACASRDPRGE